MKHYINKKKLEDMLSVGIKTAGIVKAILLCLESEDTLHPPKQKKQKRELVDFCPHGIKDGCDVCNICNEECEHDCNWKHYIRINEILNKYSKPTDEGGMHYKDAYEDMEKYERELAGKHCNPTPKEECNHKWNTETGCCVNCHSIDMPNPTPKESKCKACACFCAIGCQCSCHIIKPSKQPYPRYVVLVEERDKYRKALEKVKKEGVDYLSAIAKEALKDA